MKRHSRVLFPVAVVLGLLLLGVEFTLRQRNRALEERVVWSFSPAEVDSLRWGKGDSVSVVLVRRDGTWWVRVDSTLYPADANRVNTLLDDLSAVKGVRWAKGDLARYELDSTGLVVEVFARTPLRLVVGKTGPTFEQSFVRFADGDEVFLVRGNWKPRFLLNPTAWRRRKLFDATAEEVREVRLGDRLHLVRADTGFVVNGMPADSQKTTLWLRRLLGLSSFSYLDTLGRDTLGLDEPAYVVEVVTARDTERLKVSDRPVGPNRTYLPAVREGDPSIYGVNRTHFESNLWIPPDSLVARDTTGQDTARQAEEETERESHGS